MSALFPRRTGPIAAPVALRSDEHYGDGWARSELELRTVRVATPDLIRSSLAAITRARWAIASVALAYAISVTVGIAMASAGNAYAVERRDAIVGAAQTSDITSADRNGDHLMAALLDFRSNLLLGGVTSTALGLSVVGLYPTVAYRGWVGGIVSLDGEHRSRLADPARALYYLITLVLQLIPYSIAGGVGVRVGIGAWRQVRGGTARSWLGIPVDLLRDAARAYVIVVPLFLIASLWEFLA